VSTTQYFQYRAQGGINCGVFHQGCAAEYEMLSKMCHINWDTLWDGNNWIFFWSAGGWKCTKRCSSVRRKSRNKAARCMQSEQSASCWTALLYLWPLCESKIVARRRLRWPLEPRVMCTRTIFANLIIRVDNSSQPHKYNLKSSHNVLSRF
jgi:hypothetical protein